MALTEDDAARLAEEHANQGFRHHQQRALDLALQHYSRALELRPGLAWVWCNRGWARYQAGDPDGAVSDLDRAVELEPTLVPAYASRAWVRLHAEDFDGAVADFSFVADRNPDDPRSYVTRSWAYASAGDVGRAHDDCRFAIELEPGQPDGYVARAWIHCRQGDVAAALEDCAKALSLHAKFDRAFAVRAHAEMLAGDFETSAATFARAFALNPDDGWHAYGHATALYGLGHWKEALTHFRQSAKAAWADPGLRDYAQLRIWMTESRAEGLAAPADAWRQYLESRAPRKRDWRAHLSNFMLGRLTEFELLERIPGFDARTSKDKECQAHFHVGARRLLEGNRAGAADAFRESLASGIHHYFEVSMARAELEALKAATP